MGVQKKEEDKRHKQRNSRGFSRREKVKRSVEYWRIKRASKMMNKKGGGGKDAQRDKKRDVGHGF